MSSAAPQYTWMWCNNHKKVTEWFLNDPDHYEYQFFYSSFINAANRTWSIFIDKAPRTKKLLPHELLIIKCLCKKQIPAAQLIEALKEYNKYIGGTRGDLKSNGLIKFGDNPPEMRAIEDGETELHHYITRYFEKRGYVQDSSVENEDMEDEEMIDAETADESLGQFEIAIVGGKKNDQDSNMA